MSLVRLAISSCIMEMVDSEAEISVVWIVLSSSAAGVDGDGLEGANPLGGVSSSFQLGLAEL